MGRGPREGERGRWEEGDEVEISMLSICVPTPHKECKHHALQTRAAKSKFKNYLKDIKDKTWIRQCLLTNEFF